MMPTYNQPSFQEYREQISIIELALHVGYEWQPKKGRTLPVLYHPDLDDHIVVKNPNDSAQQVYFTTGSYTDRGTLINFVSNRLTSCFSPFNNPNRSPAQCVNDVLKAYLGIVPERKQSVKLLENYIHQSFRETGSETEFLLEQHKLCQLPDRNYLTQDRYILPDLLSSPQFSNAIAVQRIYFAEGKPIILSGSEVPPHDEHVLENLAFPYIPADGHPINGLELRTATFKSHAAGSARGHGVWISNPNELPTARLVVGESAIDVLSFRQLEISTGIHPQADTRYASIGGSLSLDHLATLENFMTPATQLIFGFDNDDKGARYALTALIALSTDGLHLTQASQQGYVALQIPAERLQYHFSTLVTDHQLALQNHLHQTQGELHNDLIKTSLLWRTDAVVPTLEIPINTALLTAVNYALIQQGQFTRSVALARPRGKDFNEDLKAELLRQVSRPILLVNPRKGQIYQRFKTTTEARQYLNKDLLKSMRQQELSDGTTLHLIQTKPGQLHPTLLGQLTMTPAGIDASLMDALSTKASQPHPKIDHDSQQTI